MKSPRLIGFDTLTRSGADYLVTMIQNYWHDRGFSHVRAERYELPEMPEIYGVRSNLVGGMPGPLDLDTVIGRVETALAQQAHRA